MPSGDDQINYLYCKSQRTKHIHLNEYKTLKKYGPKKIKLSPYLNRMINVWVKVRKQFPPIANGSVLFSRSLNPFTESTCCVYVAEAFKPTGKHITANLIRHIYISDVTRDLPYEEKKKISKDMCHNIDMQTQYIKNDY